MAEANTNLHDRTLRGVVACLLLITAPIDIISLLGDDASFRLTPFIILGAVYLLIRLIELLSGIRKGILRLNSINVNSIALALILWMVLGLSVLTVNVDVSSSVQRYLFLGYLIIIAVLLSDDLRKLSAKRLASAYTVFAILQIVAAAIGLIVAYDSPLLTFIPPPLLDLFGSFQTGRVNDIQRIGGLDRDPNRIAVNSVCLFLISIRSEQRRNLHQWLPLAAIVLTTLSRTGMIVFVLTVISINFLNKKIVRIAAVVAVGLFLVLITFQRDQIEPVAQLISAENSQLESALLHLDLIHTGVSAAFRDVQTFFIGSGWGTEYLQAPEFFGGYRYGNFHSLMVSVLVQSGILGLTMLGLIFSRLLSHSRYPTLVLVIIIANLFQVHYANPVFWIAVFFCLDLTKAHKPSLNPVQVPELRPQS